MRITLTDEEVREALYDKVMEKTRHIYCIDPDTCWMEATAAGKDVEDLEEVTFHAITAGVTADE